MKNRFGALAILFFISACAGPNPNPGERTTDMAWTSGNFQRAFEVAAPKADAGEPWAQLRLAIFYHNGWGTSVDYDKAEHWYKKAMVQKATGNWADGLLIGGIGTPGYFNQNGDARIAAFNLAELYYEQGKNLLEARRLIDEVINESGGVSIFFCCEFSQSRFFTQKQFLELKRKIEKKMGVQ